MAKWLGLDYGTRRIGVAVGDTRNGIAGPLAMVPATCEQEVFAALADIATSQGVEGIVVGWPLNMDDTEGPQGKLTRKFAARLAANSGLDVRMWDERLTSFAADQVLAGLFTRKKKKERQDAVAAATILQDFFAADGHLGAPTPDELGDLSEPDETSKKGETSEKGKTKRYPDRGE